MLGVGISSRPFPFKRLRVLDALQTDELCPCNWHKGEETLHPVI
jgi:lipoyl-dependent peroxiredoxin subunit C